MKQTAHPDERRGIHSSQRVICHYAQPARQAFQPANWIGLEDIEQAKQSERGDHRNDRGRESHGHECYELAADFIDDDLLRVFEPADPTGPAGSPDPNAEDHNVNHDQEYERLFVGKSHKVSSSHVDADAFDRAAGAGCKRRKARPTSESDRVSNPIDDAAVVVLDWSRLIQGDSVKHNAAKQVVVVSLGNFDIDEVAGARLKAFGDIGDQDRAIDLRGL